MQDRFIKKIDLVIRKRGGITCDGVKLGSNDRKYYDFVINYIEYGKKPLSQGGGIRWKFITKLSLIVNHNGAETADLIRNTLDEKLKSVTGLNMADLEGIIHLLLTGQLLCRPFLALLCHKTKYRMVSGGLGALHTN